MESAKIFYRNIEKIKGVLGYTKMAEFVRHINDKSIGEEKVFTDGYLSRMKSSLSEGSPQNVTLKILEGCASALKVEPWQLINPLGFDDNGTSRASAPYPDEKVLEEAIKYAEVAAEKSGFEENAKFKAEVASAAYRAHFSTDNNELGLRVIEIMRTFSKSS